MADTHIREGTARLFLSESGPIKLPQKPKPWSLKGFKKNFCIEIVRFEGMEMEFDLIGVEPAIANAFRRILLSEVPSMAIDKVHMYTNTSVLQDEVLAHRLGLIPFKADPRQFEYVASTGDHSEQDTLEFELKVKCRKYVDGEERLKRPHCSVPDQYKYEAVYSGDIVWVPFAGQRQLYEASQVGPVLPDILLNRLRPGQEMDMTLKVVKGIGRDHAKFSPVATASYRLLPSIELLREVTGEAAERLKTSFSPGVIEVIEEANGRKVARVKNARYDMCSRNVMQHNDLKDAVRLGRVEDHFIFSIESVGALTPDILFLEAVKVLKKKCGTILNEINKSNNSNN